MGETGLPALHSRGAQSHNLDKDLSFFSYMKAPPYFKELAERTHTTSSSEFHLILYLVYEGERCTVCIPEYIFGAPVSAPRTGPRQREEGRVERGGEKEEGGGGGEGAAADPPRGNEQAS